MAYYYVRSDGSAIAKGSNSDAGKYATKQTGTFPTNYYVCLNDVFDQVTTLTDPVDGDYIMLSDTHDHDYGVINAYAPVGRDVTVISVDDTSCADYKKGAREYSGDNFYPMDATAVSDTVFEGITLEAEDVLSLCREPNQITKFIDCDFISHDIYEIYMTGQDGCDLTFENCNISNDKVQTCPGISIGNATRVRVIGGSITFVARSLFKGYAAAGGFHLRCDSVDMSASTAFIGIFYLSTNAVNDLIDVKFRRCKLPPNVTTIGSADIGNRGMSIDFIACDTGDGYHYFEYTRYEGVALENTETYRSDGATYNGVNGFSTELQLRDYVKEYEHPLKVPLAEFELDLRKPLELVFHVAFGDDTSVITPFTNSEMWIELEQNDPNTTALGHVITTKPDDILATPTTLEADTASWNNLSQANIDRRKIPVTTESVLGLKNGQVTAYICCAKYVSTLEIFACSLHTTT